jgi:regulator of protease activity HflC (stomatin/prohibitin superfamily)
VTVSQTTQSQSNPQQRSRRLPSKRTLYLLFLVLLFVAYWIFVWQMERIVLQPEDLPLPLLRSLPAWGVNFATIFLPHVLRHFVPIILGWLLAYEIATNLVYHLYSLPDRSKARGFLRRLRDPRLSRGVIAFTSPDDLETKRIESARLRVGGPGRIVLPLGHAAVTEINGRYYRVISPGEHALDRFEYIHSLYDLRPQDRTDPEVRLRSKEGLEIVTEVSVTFRILAPDMAPSVQQPYPYDSETLRKITYSQTNLPGGKTSDWQKEALGAVKGALKAAVSSFTLNELLQDEQTEIGAHLTISRAVEDAAKTKLRTKGIELMRTRIGGFHFPEDVTELHIQYWRSYWDNQKRRTMAEADAVAEEEMELARAEAGIELFKAIAEGMAQAHQQGYQGTFAEIIAIRSIEAMEKMALESAGEVPMPEQLMPRLQLLQNRLQLSSDLGSRSTTDIVDGPSEERIADGEENSLNSDE